jgi:hypothetical protein
MPVAPMSLNGVVYGKTIELESAPGLPDGQQVSVVVVPVGGSGVLTPEEAIRQSAGGWADAGEDFNDWLNEMQRSRQLDRPEFS